MQIVIDIDEEMYKQIVTNDDVYVLDDINIILIENAIANGTPLPKGHGDLIDADAFERRCMFDSDIEDMQDVIYALRDYKPIIEADKGRK